MLVGGSHAKSEALGCATISSLRGWKREALDKVSLSAWEFPNPRPRFSWFRGSGLELEFGRNQV